jgi:hypothetical protein
VVSAVNHVAAYPLQWPEGWARTPAQKRRGAQFKTSFADVRDGLLDEIRLMGGRQSIISTNVELRRDGLPLASRRNPDDPGVAVYFQLKGEPRVFACDRWRTVADNLQAIRKTIEAMRGIERWGSSEMLERMYRGFAALPSATEDGWWMVLGVERDWSLADIEQVYRNAAKQLHPDRGGSHDAMARLNWAVGEARRQKGAHG